jgi:hypothetical protein
MVEWVALDFIVLLLCSMIELTGTASLMGHMQLGLANVAWLKQDFRSWPAQ